MSKIHRDILPANDSPFFLALREFLCPTSINDLKKIYTHIGNTHLKRTNKMASLDLRKKMRKKENPTIKSKPLEGGV